MRGFAGGLAAVPLVVAAPAPFWAWDWLASAWEWEKASELGDWVCGFWVLPREEFAMGGVSALGSSDAFLCPRLIRRGFSLGCI